MMFVEIHMIQNFAPSCLNRDDTNMPKDCLFGGYRRARISSQCQKRAIRESFLDELGPETGLRSKRLHEEMTQGFKEAGKTDEEIAAVQKNLYKVLGIKYDEKSGKSSYLLFLGQAELKALENVCLENWETLAKGKAAASLKKELLSHMDGGKAADISLFGRMLADLPEKNIDGTCQVSHSISTHKVSMETDFYTAIDDLKPDDTAGADMMGNVDFNSACHYRYADIDFGALLKNLQGDSELAEKALRAFLEGAIRALPTGKQNTFAAHNPPSYIQVKVSTDDQPFNLSNAFVRPVRPDEDGLIHDSITRLVGYQNRIEKAFARDKGRKEKFWLSIEDLNDLKHPGIETESVKELLDQALQAVRDLR